MFKTSQYQDLLKFKLKLHYLPTILIQVHFNPDYSVRCELLPQFGIKCSTTAEDKYC